MDNFQTNPLPPDMTVTNTVSPLCVTVSTTETHGPESETRVTAIGHGHCAAAIDCLLEYGWIVGCDGELLPPRWFRRWRG